VDKAKPFDIPKREIWEAFKKVKANQGAAGVDGQSVADFEAGLSNNLYKLWNRLASGSHFPPPVRRVDIPKGDSKTETRPLGIPTVADRIAQEVVKRYLEPILEPIFHEGSYGYRPGRSAIDAVRKARQRCWRYDWVLDVDVRSYFDSIDWELLLKAVRKHTDCPWVLLYIERWLKAPVRMEDGRIVPRMAGTPQGGVVSPCLANLFLHYVFDMWMVREFPDIPFERSRTISSATAEAPKRRGHYGALWRPASRPAGWCCIRRRQSSSTARMQTGGETIRSSRLTSSAMSSGRGRRSGMVVNSAFRSCPRLVQER
jgi:RNA-directed DNA polymerase